MKTYAYWINNGYCLPVNSLHIDMIINHPEKFNLTSEKIKTIYDKHNEPYGHEGKARQEIMSNLILTKGWIRVRYNYKKDFWTFEVKSLTKKTKDIIWQFLMLVTGNDVGEKKSIDTAPKHSDINIIEFTPKLITHRSSVDDVLGYKNIFEHSNGNEKLVFTTIMKYQSALTLI